MILSRLARYSQDQWVSAVRPNILFSRIPPGPTQTARPCAPSHIRKKESSLVVIMVYNAVQCARTVHLLNRKNLALMNLCCETSVRLNAVRV